MASKPPRAPPLQPLAKGTAVTLVIATACAICLPLTTSSEGERVRPYWDPAHIRTVCFGETQDIAERIYAHSECAGMLRTRLARDYAPGILQCVPGFAAPERRDAFAAAIDSSYNAGPGAFCRSPMAVAFRGQRWSDGCAAFPRWYITARVRGVPTVMPGLVTRRRREASLCLTGRWQ